MKKPPSDFTDALRAAYIPGPGALRLGAAMFDGAAHAGLPVTIPLKTLNRHGLVSGATGTGKTKTLQRMCELLSDAGVPTLIMDIKGDVSGLAAPGEPSPKVAERAKAVGETWSPAAYPVEFLTISGQPGVRLRATVSEFGPVMFAKMLELNDTQEGILSMLFKYADDKGLALLDLRDLKSLIQYLTTEGKSELSAEYGSVSAASAGVILRKVIALEQEGAEAFFGEPSFDVLDLARTDADGRGIVHILRLADIQQKPRMFSTFMLSLLAEIFQTFPEVGDPEKPRLVLFIDEAHLVFDAATKSLLDQLDTVVKLIRSKGVGIVFCTQSPTDLPASILGQLGLKVQHALRAFTAQDRKAIKLVVENFPESSFYDVGERITSLGIGEALVTALSEKGEPTPLVQTMVGPPRSRMGVLTDAELAAAVSRSTLAPRYAAAADSESAHEILQRKLQAAADEAITMSGAPRGPRMTTRDPARAPRRAPDSFAEKVGKSMVRSIAYAVAGRISRGILGAVLKKR